MSSFTDATLIETGKRREGRKVWRVIGGFYYELGYKGSGLRIYCNDGYETDLGSIPTLQSPGLFAKLIGLLAKIIPQKVVDKAKRSFCIHDVLREDMRFTLLEGNAVFNMAMEAEGVPTFWRNVFYSAVKTNMNRSKWNADEIVSASVRPGFVVTVAR